MLILKMNQKQRFAVKILILSSVLRSSHLDCLDLLFDEKRPLYVGEHAKRFVLNKFCIHPILLFKECYIIELIITHILVER